MNVNTGRECSEARTITTMMIIYSKYRKKSVPLMGYVVLALVVVSTLVDVTHACTQYKQGYNVRIRRNGYTDVIVGIRDDVEESVDLIEKIKEAFTDASELLYRVTRKSVYFREIKIVIPNSWSLEYYDDSNVDLYNGMLPNATWETYERADICVENRDMFTIDTPFVSNYASNCGETGLFINLTPEYFLNKYRSLRLFGPNSNLLVHNWVQFRYGIFPEHSFRDADNAHEFYLNSRGEVEATRCSLNITGSVKNPFSKRHDCEPNEHGLPKPGCIFDDDIVQNDSNKRMGSLMYKPYLTQLNEFCDNFTDHGPLTHNRLAPNTQNLECNGRSVWEIFRSHFDFKYNYTITNMQDIKPKFTILKNRVRKVVLLIDKAIRALPESQFITIEQSLVDFVKHMLDYDIFIGLVHFDNFAKITLPISKLTSVSDRREILDLISPTMPNKKSNIWNALSLGLSMLKSTMNPSDSGSVTGGNIILITSSNLDPNYPNYQSLNDSIKLNEIRIDSMRIGSEVDASLDTLARQTGGFSFHLTESNQLMNVGNVLSYFSNRFTRYGRQTIEILNKHIDYDSNLPIIGYMYIDESLSMRPDSLLKLTLNFQNIQDYLDVNVYEPNDRKHSSKHNLKCKDSSLTSIRTDLLNLQFVICEFKRPRAGKWTYEILNPRSQKVKINIKSTVYFHSMVQHENYYANYYEMNELTKRKKRQSQSGAVETNIDSEIRIHARWHRKKLTWPGTQVIYASVSKGFKPILNATVKAFIHRPFGDTIELTLFDDGLYADRFKNDGIYSRFFTSFVANGNYLATIEVTSNARTKVHMQKLVGTADYEHYSTLGPAERLDEHYSIKPIDRIQRYVIVGYFNLFNFSSNEDLTKPSQIKDLKLDTVDYANKLFMFSFTAPGEDQDLGRASSYEIKCSHDPQYLFDYENTAVDVSKSYDYAYDLNDQNLIEFYLNESLSSFNQHPNQARVSEHFTIDLSNLNTTNDKKVFSIKIRAIDSNNNTSPWSNMLTVKLTDHMQLSPQLRLYKPSPDSLKTNQGDIDLELENLNNSLSSSMKQNQTFYSNLFLGFLFFVGIVVLILIVMIVVIIVYKAKKCDYDEIKPVRV